MYRDGLQNTGLHGWESIFAVMTKYTQCWKLCCVCQCSVYIWESNN